MANHVSSEKRARQDIKKRANNRWKKTRARTEAKKLKNAISEKNVNLAGTLMINVQSFFDRLAKKSTMNRKTASRLVSRLATRVAKLK